MISGKQQIRWHTHTGSLSFSAQVYISAAGVPHLYPMISAAELTSRRLLSYILPPTRFQRSGSHEWAHLRPELHVFRCGLRSVSNARDRGHERLRRPSMRSSRRLCYIFRPPAWFPPTYEASEVASLLRFHVTPVATRVYVSLHFDLPEGVYLRLRLAWLEGAPEGWQDAAFPRSWEPPPAECVAALLWGRGESRGQVRGKVRCALVIRGLLYLSRIPYGLARESKGQVDPTATTVPRRRPSQSLN